MNLNLTTTANTSMAGRCALLKGSAVVVQSIKQHYNLTTLVPLNLNLGRDSCL